MGHMSGRHRHWLARLYPWEWRARYGEELDALLADEMIGPRQIVDVVRGAIGERLLNSSRLGAGSMQTYPGSIAILVRKPSGIIPIIMSLCALAVVVGSIALFGATREPDEAAAAHIF